MKFRMGRRNRSRQYMDKTVADERRRPGFREKDNVTDPPLHFAAYCTIDGAASIFNGNSFDEVVLKMINANRKSGGILVVHHITRHASTVVVNHQEAIRCRAAELLRPRPT